MGGIWQVCVFWFGMLLVPAVGTLMMKFGAAAPIMVTFLGIGVVLGYFGLKMALWWQHNKHVEFLNGYFDAALHSKTHEEIRDNLEVLLRKMEECGWTEGDLKNTSVYDRYENLRKCLELTLTAIDYKDSRRADPEALKKLKLDLPNLEIQLRSIGWGEGETGVAQRLYNVRHQYWFSFAAALRLWSGVALPMFVITWAFQVTSVWDGGKPAREVFTLSYYIGACIVSYVIARLFGLR